MLDSIITSKTRMRLLLKFFSNSNNKAYLRGLAEEFGESTNSIRVELNRLSDAGLLQNEQNGNIVFYKANPTNPFFKTIQKLVHKYMGLDEVVESVVSKLGGLELAFINGDYAKGIDSGVIDLILVSQTLDKPFLEKLHSRAEQVIQRKIRLLTLTPTEFVKVASSLGAEKSLIIYASPESGYQLSVEP